MVPLFWVNPDQIDEYWLMIEPLVKKAMDRTGVSKSYDPEFVKIQLQAERWQCWLGVDDREVKVAHITYIDVLPKRKVFCIPLTGAINGSIATWIDHIDEFKKFAKDHECSTVRGWGRKGWERKLDVKPEDVRIEFDIEV